MGFMIDYDSAIKLERYEAIVAAFEKHDGIKVSGLELTLENLLKLHNFYMDLHKIMCGVD